MAKPVHGLLMVVETCQGVASTCLRGLNPVGRVCLKDSEGWYDKFERVEPSKEWEY